MNELLLVLALIWIVGIPILTIVLVVMVRNSRQKAEESARRIDILEQDYDRLVGIVAKMQASAAAGPSPPPEAKVEPPPPSEPGSAAPKPPPFPPSVPRTTPSPPSPDRPLDATDVPMPPPSAPASPALPINWERFMGVNLFAWIGGFILFLAAAFFVKYSIDNNLISPQIRVAIGFLLAIGLLVTGLRLSTRDYNVTTQTLCSTGILILYADIFASHSFYQFIGISPAFLLMVLVTATAFLLAVRLDARLVAILGLLGGFLTPPLLSTGEDNPMGLFTYIAVLDLGLIAITLKKRWSFLILLAAGATVFMEIGWANKFFVIPKVRTAWIIFALFEAIFLLALLIARRLQQAGSWSRAAALLMPFAALGFTFYLLHLQDLAARPGALFSFVLVADLCLMAIVFLEPSLQVFHRVASILVFALLTVWTITYLSEPLLNWALGLSLGFAIIHSAFPLVLQRTHPENNGTSWVQFFPAMALILILIPILKFTELSLAVWFVVLLVDLLAVCLAVITASVLSLIGVLLLTLVAMAAWIFRIPVAQFEVSEALLLIAVFALFFFAGGIFAGRRLMTFSRAKASNSNSAGSDDSAAPAEVVVQIPALSAILPFLLLIMITLRIPLKDPSPVFGLALLLLILLLSVWHKLEMDLLMAVGLLCCLALEYTWHQARFNIDQAGIFLAWSFLFFSIFAVLPFLFQKRLQQRVIPWGVAALSGPLHFYLFYKIVHTAFPNPFMGILPAVLSIPPLASLVQRIRSMNREEAGRNSQLALFGGATLFFITLIFPIQFNREWITLGWAFEGVALLWLFRRVPHPGLRSLGCILLGVAFIRLTMNPAIFSYYQRSTVRIWNWYLYAYGLTTVCLMFGAKLSVPNKDRIAGINIRPLLYSLSTILAFYLVNIEIADYFAEGATLTFQFSGNFARDMTYSIAWAVFAFLILIVGIRKNLKGPRYAAIGLIGVTLLKLFFHDLGSLNQLYRVGALVVVAVVLILASYLYQRFVSFESK